MRSLLCGSLFLGFSLLGQSIHEGSPAINRLNTTLTALQNVSSDRVVLTRQLVDVMMALGEANRSPSRTTVEGFVDEFASALIGKNLTNAQFAMLQRSITEVLRGSTTNLNSASHLRETLAAIHVDSSRTQTITKRFLAIGEEVRGPDDSPLLGEK